MIGYSLHLQKAARAQVYSSSVSSCFARALLSKLFQSSIHFHVKSLFTVQCHPRHDANDRFPTEAEAVCVDRVCRRQINDQRRSPIVCGLLCVIADVGMRMLAEGRPWGRPSRGLPVFVTNVKVDANSREQSLNGWSTTWLPCVASTRKTRSSFPSSPMQASVYHWQLSV